MLNIKNTTDGYLKDVEIKGNTIQDAENLADIRSVGDKVEGQELYEIDVLSCGKNLFDNKTGIKNGYYIDEDGKEIQSSPLGYTLNYVYVKASTSYVLTGKRSISGSNSRIYYYDKDKKIIGKCNGHAHNNAYVFTTPQNCKYIRLQYSVSSFDVNTIQVEEGTVETPYEPYQEDKLTILSPVQLEKVGDVADRIICKNGVWGIEKNIGAFVLDGSEDWGMTTGGLTAETRPNTRHFYSTVLDGKLNKNYGIGICSALSMQYVYGKDVVGFSFDSTNTNRLRIGHTSKTLSEFKSWLSQSNIYFKYIQAEPQFIPLPHDQQVKLRTFAGQTNIHFETEIEGTIKAQVPKSIGATVNSHTEQIGNLSKELDRVKKLEESTVSTVVTESDFTTVEETANGYFEDVKLEGKTLVNLCKTPINFSGNSLEGSANRICSIILSKNTVIDKEYTIVLNITKDEPTKPLLIQFKGDLEASNTNWISNSGIYKLKIKANNTYDTLWIYGLDGSGITYIIKDVVILEGDHTQNPPEYFEGLMSAGQDVEETVVKSANINLLDEEYYSNIQLDKNTTIDNNGLITIGVNDGSGGLLVNKYPHNITNLKPNSVMRFHAIFPKNNRTLNGVGLFVYDDVSGKTINSKPNIKANGYIEFTVPSHGKVRLCVSAIYQDTSIGSFYLMLTDNTVGVQDNYIPNQSDKKRLLYYNNETQIWEKPILRQWDSIEKHSDGKYYYHKRSGEVVLNGSEVWRIRNEDYPSDTQTRFSVEYTIKPSDPDTKEIICDKYNVVATIGSVSDYTDNGICQHKIGSTLYVTVPTTTLSEFKTSLQTNPATVVYQLAEEKVYECTNIDLITYGGETNYIVNSGAISPKSILKVHSNISNVVKILQEKVSLLESNVKASQEVQDMMILESDIRILDIELALMDFMPMTLNLGGSDMLRSATYFNFLKNHIINEIYEKEYLENVMNKYLATGRINQDEYDELYKMLYPPVYDIELPIEY